MKGSRPAELLAAVRHVTAGMAAIYLEPLDHRMFIGADGQNGE
jgi:hypothetical protein